MLVCKAVRLLNKKKNKFEVNKISVIIQFNALINIIFNLCFVYRKYADIAPLLDVEDMVKMQKPDWKCVFTYVQSFYRKLNSHERNKTITGGEWPQHKAIDHSNPVNSLRE